MDSGRAQFCVYGFGEGTIPNLTAKATGLYKGTEYIADPASGMHNDSIEWTAECTNTGDWGLNGYTFTSISQAPYSFQGTVKLNGTELFEIRRSDEPEFFDGIYVVVKTSSGWGLKTHYFSLDKNSVITIADSSYLTDEISTGMEIAVTVTDSNLNGSVEIENAEQNTSVVSVVILNTKGFSLPLTGGMGDTVAKLLNLNRTTYTYYETGKTEPSIDTLVKLCRIFAVSYDVLLPQIPDVQLPF